MFSGEKQKTVTSSIPDLDQRDLVWFFGPGQCAFERSVFGDQLSRAELFTFGTRVCKQCEGTGYLLDPEQSIREAIAKIEAYQSRHREQILTGKMPRLPAWYADEEGRMHAGADGSCPTCLASGWRPNDRRFPRGGALTARSKGLEVRTMAEPSVDAMERYGMMSHRVAALSRRTLTTLVGFFGVGPRWADDKRFGQIFGVYPATPAGKTLVKQSRAKTKREDELPDDVVLATEVELEATKREPNRGKQLSAAREQATEMLRLAEIEWLWKVDNEDRKARPKKRRDAPAKERVERIRVAEVRLENVRRVRELVEVTRAAS